MHLPTPQFSRLVTAVAFNLTHPALDSMVLAWEHVADRYLKRIGSNHAAVGRIQSIWLLAVHDAVHAVLDPGSGYVFNGDSPGSTLDAALAAVARASHDILAGVFVEPADRADLDHSLLESMSLISDGNEKSAGERTGAESVAAYARIFGPLDLDSQVEKISATARQHGHFSRRYDELGHYAPSRTERSVWRRSA